MKNKLVILFSFLSFANLLAQENKITFSLQEAIDFAIENNRNAKNAALDIEFAKKQKMETTAIGLPQINANVDYQNWLKQPVSLFPAASFDNTQAVINTVENYFGLTPTSIPPTIEGFIPVTFGTKQTLNATATLSQLIFDGSYLVGLQSAKVFLEISENAKEKTDLEIRKNTINAYGNVLLAKESIIIYEKNITVLKKNLFETQETFNNGLTEQENVEQLQITLKQLQSSYNNAIRLNKIAKKMLNITIGLDINSDSKLTDNLETLTLSNINLSLLDEEENIENTLDYKIAINDQRSKELLLKLERSKALPSLTGFINGGYAGNNDEFRFLNKEQQWFGSSLIGVSLNIPVFSSLKRHASTQKAKINLEKATNNLKETEQLIKFQLSNAKSNYQFAIEQYQTAKENINLAERIEAKNQTKFFEGISSSFELRQAQQQLYRTQQELLQSMLDVITNKATLETVLNTINN
jgi:outer membrane protein TolC